MTCTRLDPCALQGPPATAVPRGPLTLGPGSNAPGSSYLIAGPLTGGGVGSTLGHTGIEPQEAETGRYLLPRHSESLAPSRGPPAANTPWRYRARPMLSGVKTESGHHTGGCYWDLLCQLSM